MFSIPYEGLSHRHMRDSECPIPESIVECSCCSIKMHTNSADSAMRQDRRFPGRRADVGSRFQSTGRTSASSVHPTAGSSSDALRRCILFRLHRFRFADLGSVPFGSVRLGSLSPGPTSFASSGLVCPVFARSLALVWFGLAWPGLTWFVLPSPSVGLPLAWQTNGRLTRQTIRGSHGSPVGQSWSWAR